MSVRQFFISLIIFSIFLVFTNIHCVGADEDPCKDQGITVKNLSWTEMWYKRKDSTCSILKRNYFFVIKPGEEIRLFSDMACEKPYCPACTYTDYKTFDTDGNCRVRILPGSTLSDM